mgnify:CR=1 FL=1
MRPCYCAVIKFYLQMYIMLLYLLTTMYNMHMCDTSTDGIMQAGKQQGFMSKFVTKCAYLRATHRPQAQPQSPNPQKFIGRVLHVHVHAR